MSLFSTFNPTRGEKLQDFTYMTESEALKAIDKSAFAKWSSLSFKERIEVFNHLKMALANHKEAISKQITLEMGKPLVQAQAEVDKSISLIDYIIKTGPLALLGRKTSDYEVAIQPLGVIYGVMPWNFPLWQVVRFALPAMMAGNTTLLKHANCVAGTAMLIGRIFDEVFPGLLLHLPISHDTSEKIIADSRVRGVSLTGSTQAGKNIASQAGKNLKKCVLELGGNDAYVILPGADLEFAVQKSFEARLLNAGQSCISAKRIFVQEGQKNEVLNSLLKKISAVEIGDPMDSKTQLGPMARQDLRDQLEQQVRQSVKDGAEILYQKEIPEEFKEGYFFSPTLLHNVDENNTAFREELFGPVFTVISYKDEKEALRLANASEFGLGGAVFAADVAKARSFALKMETGSVALNDYFRSSPEKPFGGVKSSGYGRELGEEGFMEFVNVKSLISKTLPSTPSAE